MAEGRGPTTKKPASQVLRWVGHDFPSPEMSRPGRREGRWEARGPKPHRTPDSTRIGPQTPATEAFPAAGPGWM